MTEKWFNANRPRRLRRSKAIRRLVRETRLSPQNLVYPIFVKDSGAKEPIASMPGIYRLPVDQLEAEVVEVKELGIPAVIIFGIPSKKDPYGSGAYADYGIVQKAVSQIKHIEDDLVVMTDVCLCQYTDHGHCGIIGGNEILNDKTLELLAKTAVSHAEAGADLVAPSAMMDHQVAAIRRGLDDSNFQNVAVMGYSAKYASGFYGPFREAAYSNPSFGDRRSYQMDPANSREAMKEIEIDIQEGADIVMVKPALAYLDIIARAYERFDVPIAAYNVSGEYALVKAASMNGWIEEKRVVLEILNSIRRSGAELILTYFAKDVARWLRDDEEV
ncbi:MAG: porphobilinogen synthase [Thaumarchaeota archaeon]|nr:porphobilinogen synthase [Nitrososphaerota archaeon]